MIHSSKSHFAGLLCVCLILLMGCGTGTRSTSAAKGSMADLLSQEVTVKVYYFNEDRSALASEERAILLGPTEDIGLGIMRALLDGPVETEHRSVIPRETRILDVRVKNGSCTVDLSREFQVNHEGTELLEKLTIYAIVNSLAETERIDKVQILIEGEKVDTYKSYLSIDHLLEPDMSFVE